MGGSVEAKLAQWLDCQNLPLWELGHFGENSGVLLLKGEDLGLEHFTLRSVLQLGWSSRHCLVLSSSASKADILSIIVSELSGGARALATRGCAPLVPVSMRIIGADSIVVDRESGASKRSWNWMAQYPQNYVSCTLTVRKFAVSYLHCTMIWAQNPIWEAVKFQNFSACATPRPKCFCTLRRSSYRSVPRLCPSVGDVLATPL